MKRIPRNVGTTGLQHFGGPWWGPWATLLETATLAGHPVRVRLLFGVMASFTHKENSAALRNSNIGRLGWKWETLLEHCWKWKRRSGTLTFRRPDVGTLGDFVGNGDSSGASAFCLSSFSSSWYQTHTRTHKGNSTKLRKSEILVSQGTDLGPLGWKWQDWRGLRHKFLLLFSGPRKFGVPYFRHIYCMCVFDAKKTKNKAGLNRKPR